MSALGPVTLTVDDTTVALSQLERGLLARLATSRDRRATWTTLTTWLWDEAPPSSPRNRVQSIVSGLRRKAPDRDVLVTEGAGYRLADDVALDCRRWDDLVGAARAARIGDPAASRELYHRALGLFTGSPLGGAPPTPDCEVEILRLREDRIRVVEERIGADLSTGQLDGLAAELSKLTRQFPLREGFLAQHVLCLAAIGRQSESMAAYRAAYQRIVEELGVEPGPVLRAAYDRVLAGDLPTSRPASSPQHLQVLVPTTLPRGPATFVGRGPELDEIIRTADGAGERSVVMCIHGRSGAGKSTLAIEAAHRLRASFPGGCLYLDMSGETGRGGADAVLGLFLRLLGVAPAAIPDDHDQRVAVFRSTLYGRRVLIVMDDVTDERGLAELLPTGPGAMAILTSRLPLASADATRSLRLGALADEAALALLAAAAGDGRIELEPDAASEIVRHCRGLPLALRLIGARVAERPDLTLARIAHRLSDDDSRLAELRVGDQRVVVGVELAYHQLPEPEQELLRKTALLPDASLTSWMCAALLGSEEGGDVALDRLIDAGLVDPVMRDGQDAQYRVHDLARLYARSQLGLRRDAPGPVETVSARLLQELLRHHPHYPLQLIPIAAGEAAEALGDPAPTAHAALRFFRGEQERVLALARAVARWRPDLAWRLLAASANHAQVEVDLLLWQGVAAEVRSRLPDSADGRLGGCYLDLVEAALCYEAGQSAAASSLARRARGSLMLAGQTPAAVAAAVIAGRAARVMDERALAERELRWASRTSQHCGPALAGWVELGWAILHNDYDQLVQARGACERALARFGDSSDLIGQATASYSLARALTRLGLAESAVPLCDLALSQFSELGDFHSYTVALDARAEAHLQLAAAGSALADARRAVELGQQLNDGYAIAHARRTYGLALAAHGEHGAAIRQLRASADGFHALGRPLSRSASLRELACLERAAGDGERGGDAPPDTAEREPQPIRSDLAVS